MLSAMQFRRFTAQAAAWATVTLILTSCSLLERDGRDGSDGPQPRQEAQGEIEFSGKTSPLTGLQQTELMKAALLEFEGIEEALNARYQVEQLLNRLGANGNGDD